MILKKIVANKYQVVAQAKQQCPLDTFIEELVPGNFAFSKAVQQAQWALIAECKLTSPAKGTLCTTHSVPELAKIYMANGATALSVHTDSHFSGRLEDIMAVRAVTNLPILRKEFIIDAYQIYESRRVGADAILLITHLLTDDQLEEYLGIAHELGMDCLVEVHTQEELKRVEETKATLIGINNRNLQTFKTHVQNTFDLWPYCWESSVVISESGVSTGAEAERLQALGVRGILVGEGLVKSMDIGAKTRELALLRR